MDPIRANATDIDQWADRRDAQAMLPKLIRRLVLATAKRVERLHFRSDEGIQLEGWDGIVQVHAGDFFVPDGLSGWELSTRSDIKGKADDDYKTRSEDPRSLDAADTSFVSVTARRWSNKEKWSDEKLHEGVWKDVRAYDADDLDTWLEQAPAVDLWFSVLLGKRPIGAIDLNSFWDDWSRATCIQLNPDLVIAGREDNVNKIHQWLQSKPSVQGLQADTHCEAIAYFIASLFKLPDEERESAFAKAIVVKDVSAWRQLILCNSPLILIPDFSDRSMVTTAIERGHHILFPLDRSEPGIRDTIQLSRLHCDAAEKALVAMGIHENQARDLAKLARRSIGALRRKLARFPDELTPDWSKEPKIARSLLPSLLAGRWDDKSAADQEEISRLAECEYSSVRENLISWNQKPDPPVRLVDHTWMVAASEDVWLMLARFLTDDVLERFGLVTSEVLCELDPQFEYAVSERWTAKNIHGRKPRHSIYLRGGLAESLSMMASLSDQCQLSTRSGQEWANGIIWKIFCQARDWKLWASLSPFLSELAEASPGVFLDAVEHDLFQSCPSLANLFVDSENDFFIQDYPHTGLLWALEVLAWSPEYLGRSSILLAKLACLDPGGKLRNRPIESLQRIFFVWHPCTTASLERRLKVLDMIRRREPNVAWEIITNVLPRNHSVTIPTAKPKYRNWLPEQDNSIPFSEVLRATTEVVARLLVDVGTDGNRWRTVIELLATVPKTDFDAITNRLLSMNLEAFPKSDRLMIWNALRDLLSHHLQFPDAGWVLPLLAIERVRQCYERFEPEDPVLRSYRLFSSRCSLPEAGASRGREHDKMIVQARIAAVESIFYTGGMTMLHELASKVEDSYCFGWALAHSRVFDSNEPLLLKQNFGSTETARRYAFAGMLNGRSAIKGQTWLEGFRSSDLWNDWIQQQRADYYISRTFSERTWNDLESEDAELQRLYWSSVGINGRGNLEPKDCSYVTQKMTKYGRIWDSVDFMALYRTKMIDYPQLVVEVLDRAIQESCSEKADWNLPSYKIAELLNLLEASNEVEEAKIAQFEWAFLPMLRNYRTPKILHKTLANDPEFFVEVIKWLYRAKGEDPGEITEEKRIRARLSFDLLQSWTRPPGVNSDGCVDSEKLRSWVSRARELAHANGRRDIVDIHIGQVLAHYPGDEDGAWPHRALRDLIDDLMSEKMEEGIISGIYSKRGVIIRSIYEGGAQERTISECYLNYASIMRDTWPRTARLMDNIADMHKSNANWEDRKAELDEDLIG